jgi:hypothetical protein
MRSGIGRVLEFAAMASVVAAVSAWPDARRRDAAAQTPPAAPIPAPVITTPAGSAAVEQRSQGTRPPAELVESFDGLGVGFEGPQGTAALRNPSGATSCGPTSGSAS